MELPHRLAEELGKVRTVGVITGAGLSAESGLQNLRDHEVFEDPDESDPVAALGAHTWETQPEKVTAVLGEFAEAAMAAEPNAGHHAIHRIEQKAQKFTLLTQNVDGLHQRAGSENPILAYGDLFTLECERCRHTVHYKDAAETWHGPHKCPACGHDKMRPEVALYGEYLTAVKVLRMDDAFLSNPPDLLLVVGTGHAFPYIIQPLARATEANKLTVEVNTADSDITGLVDFVLRGPASEWLPKIAEAIPDSSN